MSVIRFSTDEVFSTDSQEYEILYNAAKAVKTPGIIVEIGTRRGGSAKIIMDALVEVGQNKCTYNNKIIDRPFICIDPYGNIDIKCTNLNMTMHNPDRIIEGDKNSKELVSPQKFDYTSTMRNRVIPSLYFYGYQQGFDFQFLQLEDIEYIVRYEDGIPVYDQEKILVKDYSFIFLDGPHDNDSVELEVQFFEKRSKIGTILVADDLWMYNHDELIEKYLFERGWEKMERGNIKASYIKVK